MKLYSSSIYFKVVYVIYVGAFDSFAQQTLVHLHGRDNAPDLQSVQRARLPDRTQDHPHLGAAIPRRPRHGEPHTARAGVGEVTHRVEVFPGRPCGDQEANPLHRLLRGEGSEDLLQDQARLRQTPLPLAAAGQDAELGVHHADSPLRQDAQIPPCRGVLEHVLVHRREQENRARSGEQGRRDQALPPSVGQVRGRVGRAGGDDDDLRLVRDADMRDLVPPFRGEEIILTPDLLYYCLLGSRTLPEILWGR